MSNETTSRTTAALSSLTAKEAPQADLVKTIGKTTYRVKVHFSTTSKETMSDKIKRMLKSEVSQM
nr:transposon-encoded TnpW family protein [uncultured Lachnoclostridium sp.]